MKLAILAALLSLPLNSLAQGTISILAPDLPSLSGIAVNTKGDVFFSVQTSAPLGLIQRRDQNGSISTIAGGGANLGDGIPAISARLFGPRRVVIDPTGNLVFSEQARIRRIDLATGLITTIAGNALPGFSGDSGPALAAQLDSPSGMVFDTAGNLYFADTNNRRVRRVDAQSGSIRTVAGNGQDNYQDSIGSPVDVVVAANGDLYVASQNTFRILRVTANGVVSPFGGNGADGIVDRFAAKNSSGDGGLAALATLCAPSSLALDPAGGLFVGGLSCSSVRRIENATGIIQTVAGGGLDQPANNSLATSVQLGPVQAIAALSDSLYIADFYGRLFKVTSPRAAPLPAQPVVKQILDASTLAPVLSQGAMVAIQGDYLGPANPAFLQLATDGRVATQLDGVRVYFNDIPAPLLYASAAQINAVVPYRTSGNVALRVETAGGQISIPVNVPYLANPSILAGGVVNFADGKINGPENPAPQESILIAYGNGMGQTIPAGVDGAVYPGPDLPKPSAPVDVRVGTKPAEVLFLGQAPTFVSGLMVAIVKLPPNLPGKTPLSITIAGRSQPIDVYVQQDSPPPIIDKIDQVGLVATVGEQQLFIEGSGFQNGAMLNLFLEGARVATLPTSSSATPSQLIYVNANFGGNPGTYAIEVVNPGNQRSARFSFPVLPAPAVPDPVISGVTSDIPGLFATLTDQTLSITGSGLQLGLSADLYYNGAFVSNLKGSQAQTGNGITYTFVTNFHNQAGPYGIEVINPGGRRSGRFNFTLSVAPAPQLTNLVPSAIGALSTSQKLTFSGTGLLPGFSMDLFYKGVRTLTLSPSDIQSVLFPPTPSFSVSINFSGNSGAYGVEVINPDGQRSPRLNFDVQAAGLVPQISSISPATPTALPEFPQDLLISGTNFQGAATVDVFFNGTLVADASGVAASQVTLSSLNANVYLKLPGSYGVEVVNPGNVRSTRFNFTVNPRPPQAISVVPANPVATPVVQTLFVNGVWFANGLSVDLFYNNSKVRTISGSDITGVYTGGFQLAINFNGVSGQYAIEVVNADGGRSNRLGFAVQPAGIIPIIYSAVPASPQATNEGQIVNFYGSNFQPGFTVDLFFNGAKIASPQIWNFSASNIALMINFAGQTGVYGLEVVNPQNARSSRFAFTVQPPAAEVFSISPYTPLAITGVQNIAISARYCRPGLTVDLFFNGSKISTLGGSQITNVTANGFSALIDFQGNTGSYAIEVVNPEGQRSARFFFTVQAVQTPVITGFSQLSAITGQQTVHVQGTGFQTGASLAIYSNGSLVTTYGGAQLALSAVSMDVLMDFTDKPGTYAAEVINPGNLRSNRYSFSVAPAIITLNGVSNLTYFFPVQVTGIQSYHISGYNFAPNPSVDIFRNNVLISTVTGSQIQYQDGYGFTMASDFAAVPGAYGVEVVNPSGTRSPRLSFIVSDPTPSVTNVSSSFGTTIFTSTSRLRVDGQNFLGYSTSFGFNPTVDLFLNGSKVQSIGNATLLYVNAYQLNLTVSFNQPGEYAIEVVNVHAFRSNRITFTVAP